MSLVGDKTGSMEVLNHISKVNGLFQDKTLAEIEEYLQDTINDELVVLGNQLYTQMQDQSLINEVILETCSVYGDIYNTNCNDIERNLMSLCFDRDDADENNKSLGDTSLDIIPMDNRAFKEQDNTPMLDNIFNSLSTTRFDYDLELKLEEFTKKRDNVDNAESIDKFKTFNELYPKMISFDNRDKDNDNTTQTKQRADIFDKYYGKFCETLESLDVEQYTTGMDRDNDFQNTTSGSSSSSSSSSGNKNNTLLTVNMFIVKMVSLYQCINQESLNKKYKQLLSIVSMQLVRIYHYIDVNDLSYTFNNAYVNIKKLLIGKNEEEKQLANHNVSLRQMYVNFIKDEIVSLSKKLAMNLLKRDVKVLDFYHTTTLNEWENGHFTDTNNKSDIDSKCDSYSGDSYAGGNDIHNLYHDIEHYYTNGWYRPDMIDIGTKLNYIDQLFHQLKMLTVTGSTTGSATDDLCAFQLDIYKSVLDLPSYKKQTQDTGLLSSPFATLSTKPSPDTTISNDMITNGAINTDNLIKSITTHSNNHRWNSYLDSLCKDVV